MKKRQIIRKITAVSVMLMMIIAPMPVSANALYEGDAVTLETEEVNADLDIVVTPSVTPSVIPNEGATSADEPEVSVAPTISVTPAVAEEPAIQRNMGVLQNVVPDSWDKVQAAIMAASGGEVIDLSKLGEVANKSINIINKPLTLKGNPSKTYSGLSFNVTGSTITIEDLKIETSGASPLMFKGNNTLTLKGTNNFTDIGENYAGINVEGDNALTIEGDGSLTATGGKQAGAGIGGGAAEDGGTITINGGNVTATGGFYAGAGIGGGSRIKWRNDNHQWWKRYSNSWKSWSRNWRCLVWKWRNDNH